MIKATLYIKITITLATVGVKRRQCE